VSVAVGVRVAVSMGVGVGVAVSSGVGGGEPVGVVVNRKETVGDGVVVAAVDEGVVVAAVEEGVVVFVRVGVRVLVGALVAFFVAGGAGVSVTIGVIGLRVGEAVGVVLGVGVPVGVALGPGVSVGWGVSVGVLVGVGVGVCVDVGATSRMEALVKNPWLSEATTRCGPTAAQAAGTLTVAWNIPLALTAKGPPSM
jgi:hypothetical protein